MDNFDDSSWLRREPWIVVDPDFKREWLVPQPLHFFLVEDKESGIWSVCDRRLDIPVHGIQAPTREKAIRMFYDWCKRPVPKGRPIPKPMDGVNH
jgi:hypothetical protein